MSFYVNLPSDSSMDYFPKNSLSKFITYLPEEIKFNVEYEVGLAEFSYPKTWNNVKKDSTILITSTVVDPHDPEFVDEKIIIVPSGFYSTISDLIEMITTENERFLTLKYDILTKRVTMFLNGDICVHLPINLAMMLGFCLDTTGGVIKILETSVAPYTVDMDVGLHTIFVYSDAIALTTLGNSSVNILRMISAKGKYGETVDAVFTKPHYAPVAAPQLRTIEINVMDDTGNPVEFQRGKVHVTLHFRPRRTWVPL